MNFDEIVAVYLACDYQADLKNQCKKGVCKSICLIHTDTNSDVWRYVFDPIYQRGKGNNFQMGYSSSFVLSVIVSWKYLPVLCICEI